MTPAIEYNKLLRWAICIPGLLIWMVAAFSSLHWLMVLAGGRMQFGAMSASWMLPLVWLGLAAGLPATLAIAWLTARGSISLIWQPVTIVSGLAAMVLSLGD